MFAKSDTEFCKWGVDNPHNNIGFLLMKTCATCRKFKVYEFSPSAESLFKSFPMFSTSTYELTFEHQECYQKETIHDKFSIFAKLGRQKSQ